MLTFDAGRRASFAECRNLHANARTYLPDVPVVCCGIVGMEPGGERAVTEAEARALCGELGVAYREVDVRADDGRVDAALDALVREMVRHSALPPRTNDNAPQA